MKMFLETTKWEGNTPNHTYILDDSKSKLFGYIKAGTKEEIILSKPMMGFNTSRRTFKLVGEYKEPETEKRTWKVTGSRGDTYTVTEEENGLVCTCPGFIYRGKCKHEQQIQKEIT